MATPELDHPIQDAGLPESLYSLEEDDDGGFRVVPFDRWGRAIRLHPLRDALFPSAEEAFEAIRAFDSSLVA